MYVYIHVYTTYPPFPPPPLLSRRACWGPSFPLLFLVGRWRHLNPHFLAYQHHKPSRNPRTVALTRATIRILGVSDVFLFCFANMNRPPVTSATSPTTSVRYTHILPTFPTRICARNPDQPLHPTPNSPLSLHMELLPHTPTSYASLLYVFKQIPSHPSFLPPPPFSLSV